MTQYSCYVLWSDIGKRFYIGVSENVTLRVVQHNTGLSKWTKRFAGSWQVVWMREFPNLSEARTYENFLKSQKGGGGFWKATGLNRADFS